MIPYSDLIERMLLQTDLLQKLTSVEPLKWDLPGRIRETSDAELSGGRAVMDAGAFRLVRGALYYAADALEDAHRVFQDESSDLGSYCHGMLHRREPDFDNARYWFRRAGRLPFFARLHARASEISPVAARQPGWDPYLFTGECEQARFGAVEKVKELGMVQLAEFEVVMDYCWRQTFQGSRNG